MTIQFKKVTYVNDEGLVFQADQTQDSFSFDKMESDFTLEESDTFFEITIYSSENTQVNTRRYQKIQEVFAALGGLGHVLIVIGFILVMNQKEFILTKTLINSLYSFPQQNSCDSTKNIQQKQDLVEKNSDYCDSALDLRKSLEENALVQRTLDEKHLKTNKSKYHSKSQKVEIQITPQTPNSFIQPKKIDDDITPSMLSVEKDILMSKFEEKQNIDELKATKNNPETIIKKGMENSNLKDQKKCKLKNHFINKLKKKRIGNF